VRFPSQSQRRILRCTSNHGIPPNDSVNYSGGPLPSQIRVTGVGLRVQGSVAGGPGSGSEFRSKGLRLWDRGSGFGVWGVRFGGQRLRFRVQGS
jgi:hypothetical protein